MREVCTVRRAGVPDLAAVLEIERECPQAPHWSEVMWREILEGCATPEPPRAVWVAEMPDKSVGFAVVQSVAGVAELESVAVRPAARRRGVARALCMQAMTWAAERDAAEIHLEVRASNAAAVRMYEALGFVEQGRRLQYYRDPVEDAVQMTRVLSGAFP